MTRPSKPSTESLQLRLQAIGQCAVVEALCEQIASAYKMRREKLIGGASEAMVEVYALESAAIMEELSAHANSLDIVTGDDKWMQPVFENMKALFP